VSNRGQHGGWWQASDGQWYPPSQGAGAPSPVARHANGNAIASLVLGIVSFFGCPLASIAGLITGYRARLQIREDPAGQDGDGLAVAGIVLSYVSLAFVSAMVVLMVVIASSDVGEPTATPETALRSSSTTSVEPLARQQCAPVGDELPVGAPEVPPVLGPPPRELVIEDLIVGIGAEAPAGSTVTVDYVGVACSTGAVFGSSYQLGRPVDFPLDAVITGWAEGIPGMKVGGRRLLIVPPELGYGSAGALPSIRPDETLVFVVDLVAVSG
jgi:peptidylprolyl isomerase